MLHYTLTNDDYIAFNRHAARTSPTLLAQYRRVQLRGVAGVTVVGGLVFWLVTRDLLPTVAGTVVAAIVMWFSWPPIQRGTIEAQLRKIAKSGELGRLGATTLAWDRSGITETADASRAVVGWERLRRVEETPSHVFLFMNESEALVVPKRAGDGVAELVRFARARLAAG